MVKNTPIISYCPNINTAKIAMGDVANIIETITHLKK